MDKTNRLYQMAKKVLYTSEVMADRNKVSTDDMIKNYPDGFTITEFDFINSGDKTFPAVAVAEDDSIYFYGGTVLNNLFLKWLEGFDGDLDTVNQELNKAGGLKVKMQKKKTRSGRTITIVDLV